MTPAPPRLAVVGLGKLGACMAAAFAARGHDVVAVDTCAAPVAALAAGRAPVVEPGLAELIAAAGPRLRATTRYDEAIAAADVTFVVVPTPSRPDGRFALNHVRAAVAEIGRVLRHRDGYHVVVVTSTVLPGSMEHGVRPVLERASGRRCGVDLGLCYNPEFIALGSVIGDFLRPDQVLIGADDERAAAVVAAVHRRVCENDPPIARMSLVSAELAKIALNAFVTTKISFANMLAELCEALPGANVDDVCRSLGHDARIGSRYLRGGLGYGGPCFPRDSVALAAIARALDRPAAIPEATDCTNHRVVARLAALVRRHARAGQRVGVVGLAYKPGTVVVERAHGLILAERLAADGVPVVVHDDLAEAAARAVLGDRVAWADDVAGALAQADVAVLASPDPRLAGQVRAAVRGRAAPLVLIDCWRLLDEEALPAAVRVVPLGIGAGSPEDVEQLRALWAEA